MSDSQSEDDTLKKLFRENTALKTALVMLVGTDNREELEQMRGILQWMPVPEPQKTATKNAVETLLQVL